MDILVSNEPHSRGYEKFIDMSEPNKQAVRDILCQPEGICSYFGEWYKISGVIGVFFNYDLN